MRVTLRENHRIASLERQWRLCLHLHEALALGDEMENHDPFGARFEQRRRRIRAWGLVTPGRAEPALDEYGTDQTYDP
jgi:hypothetical protein